MNSGLPLSLPAAKYQAHKAELDAAVDEVFQSGRFILGEQTAKFEQEFASFLGAKACVGVGSGTDALEIALRACCIGQGDAVLTVSHTAVATVAAIERAGAIPLLIDVDPHTFTMEPGQLEETIAEYQAQPAAGGRARLKAIIPVHLYGQPADLPAILSIAQRHGLRVIEDCAQAHGAQLNGKMSGTWGDLGAFSFYPTKNLGAFGDGGAVVTNNLELAGKVRLLREYGWQTRYVSSLPGLNTRLDELQSALLRVLLKYLPQENVRRRELAAGYDALLKSTALSPPGRRPSAIHVFHQYVVQSPWRDDLQAFLHSRGIHTQIHYPVPIHLQPAYRNRLFSSRSGLPHTEAAAHQILSLPISPYMSPAQVAEVCAALDSWMQNLRNRT